MEKMEMVFWRLVSVLKVIWPLKFMLNNLTSVLPLIFSLLQLSFSSWFLVLLLSIRLIPRILTTNYFVLVVTTNSGQLTARIKLLTFSPKISWTLLIPLLHWILNNVLLWPKLWTIPGTMALFKAWIKSELNLPTGST